MLCKAGKYFFIGNLVHVLPAKKYCVKAVMPPYLSLNLEKGYSQYDLYIQNIQVLPDFISEQEEQSLHSEIEPELKRRRYEFDHWDDAIHGFREIDRSKWNEQNQTIIDRARVAAFPVNTKIISNVHIVDLDAKGWIKPHVDSIKFCGSIISGLSLLSDSVMRLTLETDELVQCDVLLPRRSLYIMKDEIRYKFKHAILKDEESIFKGMKVPRYRRISLVSREEV